MSTRASGPPEAGSIAGYEFGPFHVDIPARRLSRQGEPIALPSRVFDLLVYLLRHHNQLVDKEALIRAGWADAFVTDDSLIHGISVLRRAIGDDSSAPHFIVTLPRRGYQFVGLVDEITAVHEMSAAVVPPSALTQGATASATRPWWWVAVGLAGLAITLATTWGNENESARLAGTSRDVIRLAQPPPAGTVLMSGGVLSPNARQIAFVARDTASGQTHVWMRSLDSTDPVVLKGTDGGSRPFWSPEGDALGYFVGNNLMVASLVGDRPRTLTSAIVSPNGGSWGADGIVVFGDTGRGIFAVSAKGGRPTPLTTVDPGSEISHAWPRFLPDGRRFLYSVSSKDPAKKGTWVDSVRPGEPSTLVLRDVVGGVYAPTGHLLYVQHDTLLAVPFDASMLRVDGTPQIAARNVPEPQLPTVDPVSASGAVLSFRAAPRPQQLTWFDRSGRRIKTVATPTLFHNPALSSDERVLTVNGRPAEDPGLWLIDLDSTVSTRLEADGMGPMISPDNKQVAYTARGGVEIRMRNLAGQANDRLLVADDQRKTVQDWSPDGQYLVFSRMDPESGLDLWRLPLAGSGGATPIVATAANERQAQISPDGRWIAYTSDESGALEVYVQELPGLGNKRTLSVGGGVAPFWTRSGRELTYLSTDRRLMSIEFESAGLRSPSRPVPLFNPPLAGDVWQARNYYVASRDGQRFLFNVIEDAEAIPITVMVNWLNAVRRSDD